MALSSFWSFSVETSVTKVVSISSNYFSALSLNRLKGWQAV
jgi:hypothetical protein